MVTNFSISLELVLLMNWLLNNEKDEIQKLVKKAIKHGFLDELSMINSFENELLETTGEESQKLHDSILEFLIFLEDALMEGIETPDFQTTNKSINPTIHKLTAQGVDTEVLWKSFRQIKNKINNKTRAESKSIEKEKTKTVLLSQLLKNWNPKNNDLTN